VVDSNEIARLLMINLILELRQRQDLSIILIAHNFAQVLEVCDRVTFLQHGRITYETAVGDTSVQELTDLVSAEYRGRGRRAES
jgi:simple sugar transport system ATP-binding protein